MAGNVTGSIGADNVNLNNAATESTLAALLKIAQIDSKNLIEIAKKAFPDIQLKDFEAEILKGTAAQKKETQAIVQNTEALEKEEAKHNRNINILAQLDVSMTKLMDGTFQVSDAFGALKNVGPLIGTLAAGFERLASIQQQNFEAYQKLTDVGVGFGGSLTDLRKGAADTYLTLDQFQNVIKNNSKMLAMLGGTADQGAKNFVALSSSLLRSDAGSHLMALGYSTEQVNEGMASYLTMTGGRTDKELKNTDAIVKASAEYMEQLDGLARITGQSREEQQKTLQAASADAMFQAKLQGMSEDEKKKAMAGMANALATGGKGAVDVFQSRILGIPPISKEAQIFTATMGNASGAILESADNVKDGTKTMADMNESFFKAANGIQVDLSKYSDEAKAALIRQGGPLGQAIQEAQTHANKFGQQTDEDRRRAMARQAIEASQAADMAKAMAGLKELGSALWASFSPLIGVLTPVLGFLGDLAKELGKFINKWPAVGMVISTLGLVLAGIVSWKIKEFAIEKARRVGSGLMGAAGGVAGGGGAGGGGPLDAIGKAAGGGIGPALQGLATGLKSFANPMILLGATILAGSLAIIITGVGAGIAATMALIGLALPTFSGGLKTLSEVDTSNFGSLALGLGGLGLGLLAWGPFAVLGLPIGIALTLFANGIEKLSGVSEGLEKFLAIDTGGLTSLGASLGVLGVGLMTLAPFAIFGIPAAMAINSLADGVSKLSGIDVGKLEQVASALQKVKDAAPSAGEILRISIAGMVSKAVAPSESATALPSTSGSTASADSGNNVASELKTLNNMTTEMLKVMKENLEYMKRSVSATKSLSGDLLKF
jgi:hypothetical protein